MRLRLSPAAWLAVHLATLTGLAVLALATGWWSLARPDPDRFPVLGVDVSHHQGEIDWAQVAAQPRMGFAYVKATEGGDFTDPEFEGNWREARAAGLRTGAYHFFSFCSGGEAQARHFLATVPADPDQLPPAIDLEFGGNCRRRPASDQVRRELAAFSELVERERGVRPILYVTGEAYGAFIRGAEVDNVLWIRDLLREPRPEPADRWVLWQWHARGHVPGVRGRVDLDAMRADAAGQLAAR
ncbi:MAG: GH25 family lysozyme [Anaeromyxobacter sp.]